jgi:hypothetical protein
MMRAVVEVVTRRLEPSPAWAPAIAPPGVGVALGLAARIAADATSSTR